MRHRVSFQPMPSRVVPIYCGESFMAQKSFAFLLTLWMLAMVTSSSPAQPQALGPVYPVVEPDLLALLKTHAKEEMRESHSRINRNKAFLASWSKHPQGQILPQALEVKRHRFGSKREVREVLGEDFKRDWLLIDAESSDHVTLAKAFMKAKPMGRVILVTGSVEKTQKSLNTRVWFDQGGTLVKRLKIQALPAYVQMNRDGITVTQVPVTQLLKGS